MGYSLAQLTACRLASRDPVVEAFFRMFVILAGPVLLWGVISPQSAWRIFEAWRFANPQAVRPSAAGYTARRVAAACVLVLLVVSAVRAGD
jgi:hypothetical protein